MKSLGFCASLLLIVVCITMVNSHPQGNTDISTPANFVVLDDWAEPEVAKTPSYDDEIIARIIDIVDLALDALQ